MTKRMLLLALILILVSACNPSGPTPVAPTSALQQGTPLPPTALPTATSLPPSATLPPPTQTAAPSATVTPQAYGPANFPADVDPLTGLQTDPDLLDRRPMLIKIQTFPRGQRPPWALSLADIVYDYYQNNGLTRLAAIFYGNDAKQVGPIRSARLLDGSLVQMYKAIFAFGGADQRILNKLYNSDYADRLVVEGSQNCPPMCRIDPNGFNFLVTNTQDLEKYATSRGVKAGRQNLDGMSFDPQVPSGGTAGQQVFVHFSISAYTRMDYDAATGRYLRFEDKQEAINGQPEDYEPLLDRLTNEQIAADNVVVLLAKHEFVVKRGNSEIVDINLVGSGTAYAFRDGQAYEVKWNRPNPDAVLYLTFPDGKNYPLKPGTTWFEVIGQTSTKETKDPGIWRFTFNFS